MKNLIKLLGIMAVTLMIVFFFAACGDSGGGDDNSNGNGSGGNDITYTAVADDTINTTKAINFIFNSSVSSLTESDITVSDGTGTATKGSITGSGTSWSLGITVTKTGNIKVSITKEGIENENKSITVAKRLIEVVKITGGNFTMGSEDTLDSGASPAHQVTVSGYYMGKYEVTQAQYQAVMGTNPSYFDGSTGREVEAGEVQEKRPVEQVSWYDAIVFCNKLSIMESLTPVYAISGTNNPAGWGTVPDSSNDTEWDAVTVNWSANGYRLPTEAEWEYACRAGKQTAFNNGNDDHTDDSLVDAVAWYTKNSGNQTHEVGKKGANAYGLYDMHGNVYEWCWDWYDGNYYSTSPLDDPEGAVSVSRRVLRGGSWVHDARSLRSAARNFYYPGYRDRNFGFRLVRR